MAVHNAAPWLAQTIESVLQQSFTDFEFLIHDDGSTDASPRILADHAARDRRIILSASENRGLARTLNLLIERARGDYLARMDADDVCKPERFARQVAYLDSHPEVIVLGGQLRFIDHGNRPITEINTPRTHEEIDANNLRGDVSISHPTVMMRRESISRLGGYDTDYPVAQDLELWLRVAEVGRLANLPEVVLDYRVHDHSVSGSKRDLQRDTCRRACEAAWRRRGLTETRFDYRDWRMADTAESRRVFFLRYGWQAWNSGYRGTWWYYALRSVALAPFSRAAWNLLIAGAIKRPQPRR